MTLYLDLHAGAEGSVRLKSELQNIASELGLTREAFYRTLTSLQHGATSSVRAPVSSSRKDWGSIRQTTAKTATYLCAKSDACTTGLCSCRPCSGRQSARTARAARLGPEERLGTAWHGSAHFVRTACAPAPSGFRRSFRNPRQGGRFDTLSEPSNFLMFLRLRRSLGLGACRTRPGRVRAVGGLNENVASRHAAVLDDAFDASRCIDAFPSPARVGSFEPKLTSYESFSDARV
jgi:hypothetical protein